MIKQLHNLMVHNEMNDVHFLLHLLLSTVIIVAQKLYFEYIF